MRLISWNINGIRAAIKKGLWDKLSQINADVVCFQETKADADIMNQAGLIHPDWELYFHSCSMKKGYSGVATLVKKSANIHLESFSQGVGIEKFDVEGRVIVAHLTQGDLKISLINAYYPQGGRDGRIPFKIDFYEAMYDLANDMRQLGQMVVLCGDFNTTIGDIDLARPKENRNTTGCLPVERTAFDLFLQHGFIDTFRHFYPDTSDKYTYWDQITRARDRNVGWRIDYFLIDDKLLSRLTQADILDQIMGSDHCPVCIELTHSPTH